MSRGGQLARLSAAAGRGLLSARLAQWRGDAHAAGVSHDEIAEAGSKRSGRWRARP
jgi:hypothetical protein